MTHSSRPETCSRPDCPAPIVDWCGEAGTCLLGHSTMLSELLVNTAGPAAVHPPAMPAFTNPGAVAGAPRPLKQIPEPVCRRASSIPAARVQWLWPGRIPFGKITVLDGDPDKGKSFLTLDIAARFTRGDAMPCEDEATCDAGDVVLLSNEDDPADTIIPRLQALGADLERVHIMDTIIDPVTGQEVPIAFPGHGAALAGAIDRRKARIVIIDPVMAFMDQSVNTHGDQSVRRALNPLRQIAQQTGCAIVLVRHLNKAQGLSAMHRGGGSVAFVGAARSALAVAAHPVDPDRRLLAPVKCNLSRRPDTLVYSIEGDPPTVLWHGRADLSADTLLGALTPPGAPVHDIDRAVEWLRDALAEGPRDARDLYKQAHAEGIADQTLKRARVQLGASAAKQGFGKDGRWVWHPPAAPAEPSQPHLN